MPDSRARLLEGKPIADEIRTAVAEDVATFTATNGRPPGLAVVIVGRDARTCSGACLRTSKTESAGTMGRRTPSECAQPASSAS